MPGPQKIKRFTFERKDAAYNEGWEQEKKNKSKRRERYEHTARLTHIHK